MTVRRLARAAALHPWRTVLAWIAALVAAGASIVGLLDLSSEGNLAGHHESTRAANLVFSSGLYDPNPVDEIVVVRSDRYRFDSAAFGRFVVALRAEADRRGLHARSATPPRASRDRHALELPLTLEGGVTPLEDVVRAHAHDRDFRVTVTGDVVVIDDFDELSQHEL